VKINSSTNTIEKQNSKIGTTADTEDFRHSLNQTIDKTAHLIVELGKLIQAFRKSASSSDKAIFKKLKNDVEKVTNTFTEQAKLSQKLQRDNLAKARKEVSDMKKRQSTMHDHLMHEGNSGSGVGGGRRGEQANLLRNEQLQEESLKSEILHNEMIIKEREKEVKSIEGNITEIVGMMKEIDLMVNEQGDQLQLITDGIEKASVHVEDGRQQLVGAEKYDKKGRYLICLILAIIACIILGLAIGIVVALKIFRVF